MSAGTHNMQSQNLAARMGRWSAAHWKTATFGWLAFVLVALGLGGMVGTRSIENAAGPASPAAWIESSRPASSNLPPSTS